MLNVSFTLEFLILLIFYINFFICQGLIYYFSKLVTFVIWSLRNSSGKRDVYSGKTCSIRNRLRLNWYTEQELRASVSGCRPKHQATFSGLLSRFSGSLPRIQVYVFRPQHRGNSGSRSSDWPPSLRSGTIDREQCPLTKWKHILNLLTMKKML